MRSPRMNDERGVALAMAIFALVIIGILVAGSFFAGRLEQQSGQNTLFAAQAAEAAEAGLSDALGVTYSSASTLQAIPVGTSSAGATVTLASGTTYTPSVDRLSDGLFLYRSVGSRQSAGTTVATRSVGTLVRLLSANIAVNAGLTALGDVMVGGNSRVSGNDATPSEWSDNGVSCPPTANVTGVRYNGTLDQKGSAAITGYPDPSTLDPTLNSTNIFGGTNFAALKAMKTLTLSGNVSGLAADSTGTPPKCDASLESNWGAPTDPGNVCFEYFPIIYHYGDLSISGSGEGQGILLVEGNLTVQGRIDFYGPVIVTGGVDVRGTGSDDVKFYGGILAQNVTLDDSRLTGNATVNYSSCAIKRALQGSAIPTPLSERSWVQLYN
jgi:hypothetical protein